MATFRGGTWPRFAVTLIDPASQANEYNNAYFYELDGSRRIIIIAMVFW